MRSKKILIVDDSPAMRTFIRRVIELCGLDGLEFCECENGKHALATIPVFMPDVILTDINMPVMNGEEMLRVLHENAGETPSPPVIVVSTDSTTTRMERMMQLGALSYVRKPFTPEAMRDVLGDALGDSAQDYEGGSSSCSVCA